MDNEDFWRKEFGSAYTKIKISSYKIPSRITRIIRMGKILGLLSLSRQHRHSEWDFDIKSLQFLYSIIIITKIISTIIIAVYSQIRNENVHTKISFFVYYNFSLLIYLNFIFVSRKWRKFYSNWNKVNDYFQQLFIVDIKQGAINRKIFKWFYSFLFGAVLSFFLQLFNGTITACSDDSHVKSFGQRIFEIAYAEQFKVVPYNIAFGFYFCFVDFCCTLAWCFNDLFIMCIGIILHRDFEQLNEKFLLNASNTSKTFWNQHFSLYRKLHEHVLVTSELLGPNILLSFGMNLYFICFTLLLNFNLSVKNIESLVPWILLVILCTRTLAVCYFCSKINDESSKTTKILHEVSTGSNLSDLKAFQNFLTSTTIALNGMGLFWMTKQIILTLTGTIVTYELVLVQFYDREIKAGNLTTCTL